MDLKLHVLMFLCKPWAVLQAERKKLRMADGRTGRREEEGATVSAVGSNMRVSQG